LSVVLHCISLHGALPICYQPVSAPAALDAVRNKYGLPEQFVLYLGGFDQRKNVLNLVRAFVKVARGLGSDVALVLAGRPPQGHSDRKSTRLNSSHQIITY